LIALILAPVPLAAAALVLRLARPLGRSERAVIAGAVIAFAASAIFAPQAPIHDQWTHFLHLREALARPIGLLDLWDRPGFMLFYTAPAALGLTAARLASAIAAALAIAATMRAAAALEVARPWAAGLLLVAQYDFFGQASSTMTELPFAAALAIAVWGWAERRPWLVAAGAGWCAVTRPEGVLFGLLFAAALLARHRRLGPATAALLPLALWAAAGALAFGDPLWWLHGNPYRGGLVAPRLELRQLADSYFYEALLQGQPPALLLLEATGAALAVAGQRRLRFLLAPVAVSFLILTFARIGLTDAWRESRYLVAIAPVLALLAAAGLEAALEAFPRAAPPALLALAAVGAARQVLWHWRGALDGILWAGVAAHAALLLGAALLWAMRHRVSPRPALAFLLVIPLACSPPGVFGKHWPEPVSVRTGGVLGSPMLTLGEPALPRTPCSLRGSLIRLPLRSPSAALDLLGEVRGDAHLLDERELRLDPVRVLLLALEDVLEELGRAVVPRLAALLDPPVQGTDRVALDLEIEPQHLGHVLADVDLPEALHVRQALEVEHALDEIVRVLHLADRLLAELLVEALVAPVFAHAGVEEVLVDRGELVREHLVQQVDDGGVALHVLLLVSVPFSAGRSDLPAVITGSRSLRHSNATTRRGWVPSPGRPGGPRDRRASEGARGP